MPQSHTHTVIVNTINRSFGAWDKVRSKLPPNADDDADMDNAARARWAFLEHLPVLHDPQSFQGYVACIAHGVTLGAVQVAEIGRYGHLVQLAMSTWKLANPDWKNPQKQDPLPTKGNHPEDQDRSRDRSGAPGPSPLGTGEGCQTPDQPSAEPNNTHPLPSKGNHSEHQDRSRDRSGVHGPSHLGTGEGCQTSDQPSAEPNDTHPLPSESNHSEDQQRLSAPEPPLSLPKTCPEPVDWDPSHLKTGGDLEFNRIVASVLPDFETQKAIFKSLRHQGIPLPSNSHLRKNPVEALRYCALAKKHLNAQACQQPTQAA